MRKHCPNFDHDGGLDILLEIPIPEEVLAASGSATTVARAQRAVATWLGTCQSSGRAASSPLSGRGAELQLLLNVFGSPLVPFPLPPEPSEGISIRNCSSIQASTAKYIVQQYAAATGGQSALNAVESMYAVGKVTMRTSEFRMGDEVSVAAQGNPEVGGFVLWQKTPELWCIELILSGTKMSAGSNGKRAWRHSSAEQGNVPRGPARPLRRNLQGLDPRSTAAIFSDAVCIGEKEINGEDCYILKMDASTAALKARSTNSFEIIHHTIWGFFSVRTGLLIHLEDSHLVRMKANKRGESIFWETTMESAIEDYRYIGGINIAHGGRTNVTLFRYGEGSAHHKRKMEEAWSIEEIDFNVRDLTMECFLPPGEFKRDSSEGSPG